jgi:ribosomal protein S18 acetylase RimI-like enzyme
VNTKPPSPIGKNDYDRLVALWQAAGLHFKPAGRDTHAAFEQQMDRGQQVLGIETEDGQLVGSVIVTHDGRKGWINRLAVHPDYRRKGLARQLIAAAEEALRAQGIGIFAALIEPDNAASLALFLSEEYVDWTGLHYVTKRDHPDV